jgi:CBS domain-containing protein
LKFVGNVARPVRSLTSYTPIGVAIEVMRATSYGIVPIVDEGGLFQGWLTEASLVHCLLEASAEGTAYRLRHESLLPYISQPVCTLLPEMDLTEALVLLDTHHLSALPVVSASGHYQGLLRHGDLISDLTRPVYLPPIGGMATPIGVYLTTGNTSGGVGYLGLALTGLLLFCLQLITMVLILGTISFLEHSPLAHATFLPLLNLLPKPLIQSLEALLITTLHSLCLLALVRISPMAGYHAAEHQVVHALERSEPLLPEIVRTMPRVHPRCGTNLVAGFFLFSLGETFQPLLGAFAYPLFGILALLYWRQLGGWAQQYLTTRPASTKEIEKGIEAAKSLLQQPTQSNPLCKPLPPVLYPLMRLWRMGLVQIISGSAIGAGFLWLLMQIFPAINHALLPYWNELMR